MDICLPFVQFLNLISRSEFFKTQLNFQTHSAQRNKFKLTFDYYPTVYVNFKFECPPFLSNTSLVKFIITRISCTDFKPWDLLLAITDYKLLILSLDYLQINFWQDVFTFHFGGIAFKKRNRFLYALATVLHQGHPVLTEAIKFIAEKLNIPDKNVHIALEKSDSPQALVSYLRSYVRRVTFEQTKITYLNCANCNNIIRTRNDLLNYRISFGNRVSCCGVPICGDCSYKHTSPQCDFCQSFITTDEVTNACTNIIHGLKEAHHLRDLNGIPRNAYLEQFPARYEPKRPRFIPPRPMVQSNMYDLDPIEEVD